MIKYYAVRNGRQPGIYQTWADCQKQVIGFKNASFHSFSGENQADVWNQCVAFIQNGNVNANSQAQVTQASTTADEWKNHMNDETYAFVDGSYNDSTKTYGYGGFISHYNKEKDNRDVTYLKGSGTDSEMATMRNVAGEIDGSRAAIEKSIELGYKSLTIIYDYAGIAKWPLGEWKTNKEGTKKYAEYVRSVKDKISIIFVKVAGHTDIPGNEEADRLAKSAVGIN